MNAAAPLHELPLVMLVDDDVRILRSFAWMARRLRIRAVTDTCAEDALARISRDGPPAMLISDYQLPGMDGLSLLAKVRLEHPRTHVVLSTATTMTATPESGILMLEKPVDPEVLVQLIASLEPQVK